MRVSDLLTKIGAWAILAAGVIVGVGVLFSVDNQYGIGWAVLAFAGVLAPCVLLFRYLTMRVNVRTAVEHGRPRGEGEVRYCARCGLETRTADPTCTFCGGSRFVAEPPNVTRTASP